VENEFELRLTRQIEELVRSRVGALEQEISRLQREVNEAFTTLLESTDSASMVPESNGLVAQIAAELNAQASRSAAPQVSDELALVRDAVSEMGQQSSQAEVLNTLVARASSFAPRLILFVVKGSSALGWAAKGFDETVGDGSIRGMSISLQVETILSVALNSQESVFGSPYEQSDNHVILTRLGNVQPDHVLAIPLRVRGKAAAILYADTGSQSAINVEAIELLVDTAGLVVELTSLRTRAGEGGAAAAKPKPEAKPQPAAPAAGNSGELRQVPAAPKPVYRPAPEPVAPVETITPPPPQPRAVQPPSPSPARTVSEADEKQHNDARKFARLLVSEIKLYNEGKVQEGRRNHDLYDRLKEDIDRSRQMYERRVAPDVAAKFDYFYDEMVNTLAEGDPSKLGSDFPGPSVRAS
jgi:hypothetical protein